LSSIYFLKTQIGTKTSSITHWNKMRQLQLTCGGVAHGSRLHHNNIYVIIDKSVTVALQEKL